MIRKYRELPEDERRRIRERIIIAYLKEMKSTTEIAQELNLSSGTVDWLMYLANIPKRTPLQGRILYHTKKRINSRQMEMLV